MPKPFPTRYRATNWSHYNAALRKRGSLSVWFDPKTIWHAEKSGKRGRPETFSDAAIQTWTLPKTYKFRQSTPSSD